MIIIRHKLVLDYVNSHDFLYATILMLSVEKIIEYI